MASHNNSHGNDNESNLVLALNEKKFNQLNLNLKEFIRYICSSKDLIISDNDVIYAKEERNNRLKQDLYVIIHENSFGVSLKMGSGNSVHQEKCADFLNYITSNLNANEKICRAFSLLLWNDGTTDGSGSLEKNSEGIIMSRYTSKMFRSKFPAEADIIQNFLNENAGPLINRFLFVGRHGSIVDFVYHGTVANGTWISTDAIISFQLKNPIPSPALTVGRMSIQTWNASMKGTSEHKRGQLQVKYGQMESDFSSIMLENTSNIGTFSGDKEEYTFSKMLNKNKSHHYWKQLLPYENNFSDYFVVVVDRQVLSNLSNKKVFTKTDDYVIKKVISRETLLKSEYLLTESDIENCHTFAVNGTGVSVKMRNSTKYTLLKLTKDSFIKAFSPYDCNISAILTGLLLYSKESEMHKNTRILSDFNFTQTTFIDTFNLIFNENFSSLDSATVDEIRSNCQAKLHQIINANIDLKTSIFTGKGWFDSPYYVSFIFKNNELSNSLFTDFSITTGSGRSSGKYSIEIKPK
ncbi:MAG: hypothetical protein R3Y09_08485 [Clostridia bacterium]